MKFSTLLSGLIALRAIPGSAFDNSCFELPIVIVSPTSIKLPTETCNQPRFPARDCMKDAVPANIEVIDNADGILNCLDGNRTAIYTANAHYRGQSSLHFSKHQIGIELDEDNELLGFPADRTFVLNGPTVDASLIRNHLAHWMFRATKRYSPRTRHIVVFVRDRLGDDDWRPRYRGIYLALEKIAYTPNRVGLTQLNGACQSTEELSGGWAWQNNPLGYGDYSPNLVTNEATGLFGAGARPILTFPEPRTITQSMRDYFVSPETGPLPRLYQYLYDNMTQPDGLEKHIDIGSFVDYFLHSELSMNSDAYRRSTYFFKDRGQPINAGPVWDFNLAYGLGGYKTTWMYTIHTFWKRLTCNYKFASLVQQRWVQLRSTTWSNESITSFIQTSGEPLRRQLMKCHDWKSDNLQCANVEAKTTGSFDDEINGVVNAVLERAHWMDSNVFGFYQALNSTVCVAAGEIPAYNCAADGSDKGCLATPSVYSNAVAFPEPRKPMTAKACDMSKVSNSTIDKPSIDPCWLSAGVYMSDGSITPFCSGYGFCPEGPGATCTCKIGHHPPTCARIDDPIIPHGGFVRDGEATQYLSLSKNLSRGNVYNFWLILCALSAVAVGIGLAAHQRRRERKGLLNHFDNKVSLRYGTS
ncbi:Spore coat protein CotH [Plasmopara halstedii]|uniref:Spore coat protein CotH n=1 Tax=Plasmopara halstedii TaxID=4781 RepID=A0A0P1B298_PLAHL|nr:Spore coat protein CotH [Plasmopara halstedii]CEG48858.1 Spore coat protein CotH [Plasmopara halstedii]|eukprot:XP_024585227.1 Spore coat protein CotH [Plasmopara halstedii]